MHRGWRTVLDESLCYLPPARDHGQLVLPHLRLVRKYERERISRPEDASHLTRILRRISSRSHDRWLCSGYERS
jgi:hypothetical protein